MADEEFLNRSTGKCLQAVKPELESSDSAGDGPALRFFCLIYCDNRRWRLQLALLAPV